VQPSHANSLKRKNAVEEDSIHRRHAWPLLWQKNKVAESYKRQLILSAGKAVFFAAG
jgi:hypothetical protein